MPINRLHLLALPAATASLALAACGGGGASTAASGDQRAKFRDAALHFAKCMREHGVNMPDPKPGTGGLQFQARGSGGDPAGMQRAQKACQKILQSVRPPELSEQQKREFRDRALKNARCMRAHGIDMPDPTFGERGTVRMRLPDGAGPNDPRFQQALKACAKYGPKMGGGPLSQKLGQ